MNETFYSININTTGTNVEWDAIFRLSASKYDEALMQKAYQSANIEQRSSILKTLEFDTQVKVDKGLFNKLLKKLDLQVCWKKSEYDSYFEDTPDLQTAITEFANFIGDAPVAVYNESAVIPFLEKAYQDILGKPFSNQVTCVLKLAKQVAKNNFTYKLEDYNLLTLAKHYFAEKNLRQEDLESLACKAIIGLAHRLKGIAERRELAQNMRYWPKYPLPKGQWGHNHFACLVEKGLEKRYGTSYLLKHNEEKYYKVLGSSCWEQELIFNLGFTNYFLIIYDILQFAKSSGMRLFPIVGATVSSVTSYALGITEVEPLEHKLIFEKFINIYATKAPYIKIAIEEKRQAEILQYIKQKYGASRVAKTKISFNDKDINNELLAIAISNQSIKNLIPTYQQNGWLQTYRQDGWLYTGLTAEECEKAGMLVLYFSNKDTLQEPSVDNAKLLEICKALAPISYNDFITAVSLCSIGSTSLTNAVIQAKNTSQKVDTVNALIAPILQETYGILIYQEQLIRILNKVGDLKLRYANVICKIIANQDFSKAEEEKSHFIIGAANNDISKDDAIAVFDYLYKNGKNLAWKAHATALATALLPQMSFALFNTALTT